MKHILFILVMCIVAVPLYAQTITIKDKDTQLPISNVVISLDDQVNTLTSNNEGQVLLPEDAEFSEIIFRNKNYKPLKLSNTQLEEMEYLVTMEHAFFTYDEIIISATKSEEGETGIAQAVTSISEEQVALENPQTAADLLGSSGKVYIQKSQQGGGSPMIRGFATNRLLYSVDGVRMNSAIFRGGNIQNVISLDPLAIENTEVLFGPGSVLYGSDAIGGVMSFKTLSPQFSLTEDPLVTGKAVTRYSSANQENTVHFDANVGWKKFALLTSFTTSDYKDLRMGSNGPDDYLMPYFVIRQDSMDVVQENVDPRVQRPSAYSQINLMQKLSYQASKNILLEYGFHYSETSSYGRYDRHNRMKNGLPRYAEWNYGPQKWMMNQIKVTNTKSTKVYDRFTINIAQQRFEESRISRNFNKDDREIRAEKVDALSGNFDFAKRLGKKNKFNYGVEYVYNDITSTGINENIATGLSQAGASRYPQSDWQSAAIYLSNVYSINKKMSIHAGARYNQYMINANFDTSYYPIPYTFASLSNGALTGSFGWVYIPNNTSKLSINASTGFRSPNIDDIGKVFDSEPGAVVVPNKDLEAEYAYNIDLDYAKIFNDAVKVDVAAYYTYLNNAHVRRDFILDGQDSIMYDGQLSKVQAIQNAANAQVYGLQLGLDVKFLKHFNWSTNVNYQYGEEELDNGNVSRARHAAPFFGRSALNFKQGKLMFNLNVFYQAERKFEDLPVSEQGKTEIYAADDNGNPYSPSYYTLNFKAMYTLNENIAISAGVENLTDIRYRSYSSGLSGAGRNMVMSLRIKF
ncbi:TonB-dependent receptor plug domain-containing protein [Lishizhenia sp.]|uniref:TonB-dependent receptor plug domain-containing protein n=1 Tax=Lishizhenia sp. TaxID=2497594 RepID=UPI00299E50FB|nr:TonB-dependent receptor [Lishizhenia sp.]MDX1445972.1 TonB-dependent receptor [Lishizhenia sp.]